MRANSTAQLGKERCPAQHVASLCLPVQGRPAAAPPGHHVCALSAKLTRWERHRDGAQEEPRRAGTAKGCFSWGVGTARGHVTHILVVPAWHRLGDCHLQGRAAAGSGGGDKQWPRATLTRRLLPGKVATPSFHSSTRTVLQVCTPLI